MPRGPKGESRPADTHAAAIKVARIAVIEDELPTAEADGKNQAAVALGRRGGAARAKSLSKERRTAIAKKAAKTRWREPSDA
jgi:RNase adaptor protein for sRNA GlmZ degradation